MLEENSAVPGLQPAVGRLANALVAVLGPELTLGSPAYCSCRALIREMQVGVCTLVVGCCRWVLRRLQLCTDQEVCAPGAGSVETSFGGITWGRKLHTLTAMWYFNTHETIASPYCIGFTLR